MSTKTKWDRVLEKQTQIPSDEIQLSLSLVTIKLSLEELKQRQQCVYFFNYNPSNSWSLKKKERKNVKEPCERERASLSIRCSSRTIRIHRRLRFPTISWPSPLFRSPLRHRWRATGPSLSLSSFLETPRFLILWLSADLDSFVLFLRCVLDFLWLIGFLFNNFRNLSCYGKENARMHCIHCSSLARGGQCGIWHQWQWLRSYLEGIVFRYTPERVVSKGFFLMLREANLKELPVGSKYHFFLLRYGKL